uniref:EamA domain-containing protein n=1 Tax=Arcella intermedia TaxID=1963864 RepID=A0A6B2LE24_9EUKA
MGIGLPQVCSSVTYLYGLEYSNPVNCGILYLLSVPTTAIFGMLLKLEQRSYVKLCGVLFAFGGALVMLELDKFSMSNDTIIGDLIVLGMVLFHATYLLITKRLSSGFKAFTVTFWSFFSGACFTFIPLPIMMLTSTPITYSAFTPDIWISIAIVCIIGTAIPGLSVIWALQNSSSLVVAVYSPLELVATVLLGLIFLNLELKWVHGVGAVLIVSGLFIVLYAKHKEQMEEQKKDPPGGNPVTEHQETNEDPTESERLSLVSLDKWP